MFRAPGYNEAAPESISRALRQILKRVYLAMRTLLNEATRQRLSPDLYGRVFTEQMDVLSKLLVEVWKEPEQQMVGLMGWDIWATRLCRHSLQYHPKKVVRDAILKR